MHDAWTILIQKLCRFYLLKSSLSRLPYGQVPTMTETTLFLGYFLLFVGLFTGSVSAILLKNEFHAEKIAHNVKIIEPTCHSLTNALWHIFF